MSAGSIDAVQGCQSASKPESNTAPHLAPRRAICARVTRVSVAPTAGLVLNERPYW